MSVLPPRKAHPLCALALLTALVASAACVDLQEPWRKARVGGGDGSIATGGAGGAIGTELAPTLDGDVMVDGSIAAPPSDLDGALAADDGGSPLASEGGGPTATGGQAGLSGTGGSALGGNGGGLDGSPIDVGAGGTGGTPPRDAPQGDAPSRDVATDQPPGDSRNEPRDTPAEGPSTLGLLAYYACEGAGESETTLVDSSGNDNHGVLSVGATSASTTSAWSFDPGKIGTALTLRGRDNGYVALPAGLLAGQKEATFAVWLKLNSTSPYQRVFDFGTDTSNFMYLATASSHNPGPRFRIAATSDAGASSTQTVETSHSLSTSSWTHLALVISRDEVSIYIDGRRQASNGDISLRPADLGNTTNNFIGRSAFSSDSYLDAAIDEYRIYSRALSSDEIAVLAGR